MRKLLGSLSLLALLATIAVSACGQPAAATPKVPAAGAAAQTQSGGVTCAPATPESNAGYPVRGPH